MKRLLFPAWVALSLFLLLYSYTQVSLSLALTRVPFLYEIERTFQYIGYFNRPLSTVLYILLILLFYVLFLNTLRLIAQKQFSTRQLFVIISAVSLILLFAYNAFSFDLFNYIFDAKILTHYHQNPYLHKALDFPDDPMLSFMQWTHRTYPYGPVWLVLTLPFSYLGGNIFIVTFFLFKFLAVGMYGATAYVLYRILQIKNKSKALFVTAFFALNPFVLIEFVVSSHNDMAMMFLAVLGIYLFVKNRYGLSVLFVTLSILTKYATAFLIPMFLVLMVVKRFSWEWISVIGVVAMSAAVIAASINSGNFQPWYMIYVLIPACFIAYKKYVLIPAVVLSVFGSLYYVPFLRIGNWEKPIPQLLLTWMMIGAVIALLSGIGVYFISRKK